ncbi:hypothetical protein PoB_001584200 [Plakobranchus ocellatus]|uniref:Uncharacterized protein n=1 Tax=Plakobranchus ocellatus TaxID=259542 RepID=A0AAV3Z449_9GAST|nr:hypothetical protein PoB_001584200 [Plakobranchus ocellatus]
MVQLRGSPTLQASGSSLGASRHRNNADSITGELANLLLHHSITSPLHLQSNQSISNLSPPPPQLSNLSMKSGGAWFHPSGRFSFGLRVLSKNE